MKLVGILGSGAWGCALAVTVCEAGREALIWGRSKSGVDEINNQHTSSKYLPGIRLNPTIQASIDLGALVISDVILLVVPAQTIRENCENLRKVGINKDIPIVICSKGIEQGSNMLMSEVVRDIFPNNPIASLSGPNFAHEIASGLPAGATLACENKELGIRLAEALRSKVFRVYYSNDLVGAEIGGAVKNVLAIACGIAVGRGLGENARATLVTRGLAEIGRLCVAKGGKPETLLGLSGVGDVMLTCGSLKSRNMKLGSEVGQNKTVQEAIDSARGVIEGIATAKSVVDLASSLGVEMPIAQAVNAILHKGMPIDAAIRQLLERPLAEEVI